MNERPVIIIGGGPAGLASAIALGQLGVRVLVVERKTWPVDKPCGEGLMPTGWADLAALGVTAHLPPGDQSPISGIAYHLPDGTTAKASFAEGPGRGIRRLALSRALFERAATLPTVTLRSKTAARVAPGQHQAPTVEIDGEVMEALLVIGADGLHSRVRSAHALAGPRGTPQRYGLRQHFGCAPWSDQVEVYWQPGFEAYVTPVSRDEVGVAFLWDKARGHVDGGPHTFDALRQRVPLLDARLGDAPTTSAPRATGPFHRRSRAVTAPGLVLVGDAAGYLDAITGEGLSLAFAQARALASATAPDLLAGRRVPPRALRAYAHAYQRITGPYYRMTQLALWLSASPAMAKRAVQGFHQAPDAFRHLLSANMGTRSLLTMPPRAAMRFLAAFVRG